MSSELKQLFHSPEDLSDSELDIMRVKLQNMRRIPKYAAAMGLVGAAFFESVVLRKQPRALSLIVGTSAGYAFGGFGVSTIDSNILKRNFDYDIIIAQEKRQQARTMNLAGYGNNHISGDSNNSNRNFDKPY